MKPTVISILIVLIVLVGASINIKELTRKPQPIVGTTVVTAPEEPKVPVYTVRIAIDTIAEFTSHALGSKGFLVDDIVVCTGEKGGQCIIVIELNCDEKWVYFQDCGITTTPIAMFDRETQEWVIAYTKRLQLL